MGYTDRIIKLYLFSWTALVTLCIGLLSLGITVYEESIVMNGSEFLSRVYTLGTCAFRLQLNVVLSPFPLSNSLSPLFLSALVVIRLSSGLRRFRWLWHKPKAPLGPAGVYEVSGIFCGQHPLLSGLKRWNTICIWVAESGVFGSLCM